MVDILGHPLVRDFKTLSKETALSIRSMEKNKVSVEFRFSNFGSRILLTELKMLGIISSNTKRLYLKMG